MIRSNSSKKEKNIHVAFLKIFFGMLVDAILLAAFAIESKKPTDGHARLVVLM